MIIAIPFHEGDVQLLFDFFGWCQTLEGCAPYRVLLVADKDLPWTIGLEALEEAQRTFSSVTMVSPPESYKAGWPKAPNQMFLFTAEYVSENIGEPWLWLEPDAIPMKPAWATLIEKDYARLGRPYMGAVVNANMHDRPVTYLNGVAVYPANAFGTMGPVIRASDEAFDVACTKTLIPMAANTRLIQCNWGQDNRPPIFGRGTRSIMNGFMTLDMLSPEAVIFHRNKDGSLINLLREQRGGGGGSHIDVVLAFCNKDSGLMLKNLQWMHDLSPHQPNPAFLCYPKDVNNEMVRAIEQVAQGVFSRVRRFVCPGSSHHPWPQGPNLAFQATARHMETNNASGWLWLESDAVPLQTNWLQRLEHEYRYRRKGFFGPIVQNRGHMNGVAIYPKNMASRCPQAMAATTVAWDYVLAGELGPDVFDAGNLIQHCWGIVGGQPHSCDGPPACFASADDVHRWLIPNAALFHRCKDGSLINRLREMRTA